MQATPVRLFNAVLWPVTIWASLGHLEEHPADDYVERTSPIVATAIAFWIAFAALLAFANPVSFSLGGGIDGEEVMNSVRRVPGAVVGVLYFFVPVIYLVGFWLFTARDERFPR